MNSKISNKEWNNIVEQFAYRKSNSCIKLEDYNLLIGGNYSWNTCLLLNQAEWIYNDFHSLSDKLFSGQKHLKRKLRHFIMSKIV